MAFLPQSADDQGQNQNNLTPQVGSNQNQSAPPINPIQTANTANSPPPSASPMGAPAPSQKGSGRFTNLQKYVGANKGAGEQLTNQVQKGIEKNLSTFKQQSQKAEQTGQQGIQSGQQTLQTGQNLNQQMAAEDFTPQRAVEFAGNQDNVNQVGQFRTGQAVNEADLQAQNQMFGQANASLGQKVNEQGQAISTEANRIGFLKDLFGGRGKGAYTTGGSRLDNLLLQSNGQNLTNLQSNIQGQQSNVRDLQARAAAQGKTIEQVIADESRLAQDITGTTEANVGKFKTGLGGQVAGFNKDLEAGIKSGNTFIDFYNKAVTEDDFKKKYGISKKDYQFNKPLFDQFGLKSGQQTFNVFNNQDLNLGQVADIEGRRAQDWRDVATQQNVGEYDALARLRGIDRAQYELDKASDINKAGFKQKEGEASLQGRITKAQQDFLKDAQQRLVEGGTGWVEGVKGSGFVSAADYLANPDYYKRAQVQYSDGSGGNLGALRQFGSAALATNPGLAALTGPMGLSDPADITRSLNDVNSAIRQGTNIGVGGEGLGDLVSTLSGVGPLSQLSQSLFGGGGGNDTAKGKQYVNARTIGLGFDGIQNEERFAGAATGGALANYLASQGFSNYLTEGGVEQGSGAIQDQAREFGYRTNVQGPGVQQGFYNPMFERQAIEQAAATGGPVTREQIAELSRTGGTAAQQAARQALIDSNRYLTSDKEYGEIVKREQDAANKNLMTQAGNRLTDIYRDTDIYKNAINQASQPSFNPGDFLRLNPSIAAGAIAANAPRDAQQYAQNNAEFAKSAQGLDYQKYFNELQQQAAAQTQANIAKQVYGRNPGQGELNTTQASKSGPMTLDEILARMGRA